MTNKIRAGILSMQRICNYGSFLQAYGLKSILEELGCEVEFVDYEPGKCLVESTSSKNGIARKTGKIVETLKYDARIADKLAFMRYKKDYANNYFPLLGITSYMNTSPDVDILVIGSDEVFNCVQDNANVGFTPALFGHGSEAPRKITYAASFGNTTLDKLVQYGVDEQVGLWLSELDMISVRDSNSKRVVDSLCNSDVVCHLDPVLIYDYFEKCPYIPQEVDETNFMIVYGYSGRFSKEECQAIRHFADERSLKIIDIGGIQSCCDRFIDKSPFEVLGYFKHADAIVTDTFHGTILSVIAKKPVAIFVRESGYGNAQKLTDLCSRLSLDEHIVVDIATLSDVLSRSANWTELDLFLTEERKKTFAYLKSQLDQCVS